MDFQNGSRNVWVTAWRFQGICPHSRWTAAQLAESSGSPSDGLWGACGWVGFAGAEQGGQWELAQGGWCGTWLLSSGESAPVDLIESSCTLSMNIKSSVHEKNPSSSSKLGFSRVLYANPRLGGGCELLRPSLTTYSPDHKIHTLPVKTQHRVFHFCLYLGWISPGTSDNILTCDRCFLHKDIFQTDFSPATSSK